MVTCPIRAASVSPISVMKSGSVLFMAHILHDLCYWPQEKIHTLRVPALPTGFYDAGMDHKALIAEEKRQIGARLAEARTGAGLTQGEATDALNRMGFRNKDGNPLEPSRLGNYEQGKRMPDHLLVKALCKIYGAFPSKIYGFDEAPQEKDELALLSKYRQTDERGKRAVQSIADSQPSECPTAEVAEDRKAS